MTYKLAALVCLILALVSLLVPTTLLGAPALAWFVGGMIAWLLASNLGIPHG